ncbi:hypothetical protein [Paracoccus sp. MC1862]|uniref:hypothetical protein n=1 Tax=Paracoccus sp. MC1862 TaxID=2760307 RepID=UPI0016007AFD|nr:hypothetical protein [Paracoccus sp. MC1862]MBB1498460.1 hypothetical protein [Paracoccus sp. MC1862]QQO43812.1 hypothetical protein JGR78_10260 [Paracoccus sp. MC1862]
MNASVGADERLVVMLEARVSEFEKRMRQAEQRGTRTYDGLRRGSRSATRDMERDMNRAAASMRQSVASISGSIGSLGRAMAGGFLGGLAIGGLSEIVSSSRQVVQGLANIGNEARRAGLSAQAFQEWAFVADTNRISVDALVDGFKELSLRADEFIATGVGPAAEAFGRLGYRAEDLKRKLKDPSALMLEIMERLEGMDKAAQIRIADEIFGGTGGERFVEMLGQGEGALRDTIARAHEAGAVLDDELIQKADELDRRFRELQTTAGNFFKRVIVGAADVTAELADTRARLDEIFSSEAEGRMLLGDDTYDALRENRDLVDENRVAMEDLEAIHQQLAETATATAAELRGAIGLLDSWGYDGAADALRIAAAEMDALSTAFQDGEITGDEFAAKLVEVQGAAEDAFAELEAGDRVQFTGVMSQLTRLGGVISSVTALAGQLRAALSAAAGTSPSQVSTQALRDRHAAEQASMESARALAEANDRFTDSETARNSATREQLALEREMASVRQRAKETGATLTDAEVRGFAEAAIAGEAGRAAAGAAGRGGGGGGGSGRGGGRASRERQSGFDRDVERIRERIDAYQIEAAVLTAAALSGETYGDVMAYAGEKAKLLAEAQKEGREITPQLEAQIDGLARAYAEAGQSAEDAAERLEKVQEAGERGAEAVSGIFTAALQGADAAKQAVAGLLDQIAEAMMNRAFSGLAASGGAAGGFFAGLGSLLGFAGGGFTGSGGKHEPAGIVHRGEYVMSAEAVKRIGVRNLDAIHKGSSAQGGSGGGSVTVNATIDLRGTTGDRALDEKIRAGAAHAVAQANRAMPSRVAEINRDPLRR